MKSVQITCIGRVQGVFYRASTRDKALALGVEGWVRNEPNGDVRIHAKGEEEAVDELIHWCHRGPELAKVDRVVVEDTPEEPLTGFEIRRY